MEIIASHSRNPVTRAPKARAKKIRRCYFAKSANFQRSSKHFKLHNITLTNVHFRAHFPTQLETSLCERWRCERRKLGGFTSRKVQIFSQQRKKRRFSNLALWRTQERMFLHAHHNTLRNQLTRAQEARVKKIWRIYLAKCEIFSVRMHFEADIVKPLIVAPFANAHFRTRFRIN